MSVFGRTHRLERLCRANGRRPESPRPPPAGLVSAQDRPGPARNGETQPRRAGPCCRAVNVIYTTGYFHLSTERPLAALIPKSGDPALFIPGLESDQVKLWVGEGLRARTSTIQAADEPRALDLRARCQPRFSKSRIGCRRVDPEQDAADQARRTQVAEMVEARPGRRDAVMSRTKTNQHHAPRHVVSTTSPFRPAATSCIRMRC